MKSIKYTIIIAAALTSLASCRKNDLDGFNSDPDAVRITAKVGDVVRTRVNPVGPKTEDRTIFTENDQIKVSADSQDAVTYTLKNGVWTPEEGKYLKWNTSSMKFNAYYPAGIYNGTQTTVPDDQHDEAHIAQADYMKAENIIWDKSIGAVEFSMQRQTARVVISEIKWANQYDTDVYQIFDITLTDGVSGRIRPFYHGSGKYYALLMPTAGKTGEGNFMEITVWDGDTAGSKENLVVKDIPEFEAGYSYECTLTIGKDKVSVSNVAVEDWATGGVLRDDEGTAEEHLPYIVMEDNGVKTYIVDSEAGLRAVNRIITSDINELGAGIILAANITLTGENNWTPIGNWNNPYTGIFNGNQKTITGLHINNETADCQALIGYLEGGTVKDLTLADSKITGKSYVGGVVGDLSNSFSITNVTVKDCEIEGVDYVGGVIGYSGDGTISGATLLDSKVTADGSAGGIVGETTSVLCNIENCLVQSNTGKSVTIIANDGRIGGIAGRSCGPVLGCKVINGGELTIRTNGSYGGGIAGYATDDVAACLVLGANVTAQENVGGIVGNYAGYGLSGNYAYGCTTGETPEAFAGAANVVGMVRAQYYNVSSCYYHAYNDSEKFVTEIEYDSGTLSTKIPVDWDTACGSMNNENLVEGYVWSGTYDAPILTAI